MPKKRASAVISGQPWSFVVALACALFTGSTWSPGVLSPDSITMIEQAMSAEYSDVHALLLPVFLRIAFSLGGSVGLFTLVQAALGFLGIRILTLKLLSLLGLEGVRRGDAVTVLILLLFQSPLSPVGLYLVTVWTDTWMAIFLLWFCATALDLADSPTSSARDARVWIAAGLLGLIVLVRHNGIVVYPAGLYLLWRGTRSWVTQLTSALVPACVVGGFLVIQTYVLKPYAFQSERAVYALDLASMIIAQPNICNNLGLTSCDLVIGVFSPSFVPGRGAIDYAFDQSRLPPNLPFSELFVLPDLAEQYFMAARDHPLLLARVKTLNYLDYLLPDSGRFFYPSDIPPNDLGLDHRDSFSWMRQIWIGALDQVKEHSSFRWISFVHGVWLFANLLALLLCWDRAARGNRGALEVGLLLLLPASYYAGFWLALSVSEFRFMFPSMVIVQTVCVCGLLASLAARLRIFATSALSPTNSA